MRLIDPPPAIDDIPLMADWVELSTLTANPPEVSRDVVGETLDQAGLLGLQDGGGLRDDENWEDEDTFTPDDASDRYVEEVWTELRDRRNRHDDEGLMEDSYPFDVYGDMITSDGWKASPAYTMLLLLDHGREYDDVDVEIAPETEEGRLFEKIVEASAVNLFGGPAARFGWPKEPHWPTHPRDRIKELGKCLGLEPSNLIEDAERVDPNDKDKGLDIACLWRLGGDKDVLGGLAWILLQCACGKNWKGKVGEPQIGDWQDLLGWSGPLVKAVAMPWRELGTWSLHRASRRFDRALVLNRDRLVLGHPDVGLSADVLVEVIAWCEDKVRTFPGV